MLIALSARRWPFGWEWYGGSAEAPDNSGGDCGIYQMRDWQRRGYVTLRSLLKGLAIASAIAAIPVGLAFGARAAFLAALPNFSRMPPAHVFNQVFGSTVPPGVSDVRVGSHPQWNAEIWLRFRADEDALKILAPPQSEMDEPEFRVSCRPFPNNEADRRAVSFDDSARIRHPKYYSYSRPGDVSAGWVIEMVVDCEQHLVYAHATAL